MQSRNEIIAAQSRKVFLLAARAAVLKKEVCYLDKRLNRAHEAHPFQVVVCAIALFVWYHSILLRAIFIVSVGVTLNFLIFRFMWISYAFKKAFQALIHGYLWECFCANDKNQISDRNNVQGRKEKIQLPCLNTHQNCLPVSIFYFLNSKLCLEN